MATVTRARRPAKPARPHVVSLALAIDHQCYGVTPILGIQDPDVTRAFRLEKKSDRDAVYDVARTALGFVTCSCPDYIARHEGNGFGLCKHGRALVELGLLDAPGVAASHPEPAAIATPAARTEQRIAECGSAPLPAALAGFDPAIGRFLAGIPEVMALPAPTPPADDATPGEGFAAELVEATSPTILDDEALAPAEWPAWTDVDAWVPDDLAPGDDAPGDDGSRLDLEAWVRGEAGRYRRMGHDAGDLVARVLADLADEIELTGARDAATYRDRIAALDGMAECGRSAVGR